MRLSGCGSWDCAVAACEACVWGKCLLESSAVSCCFASFAFGTFGDKKILRDEDVHPRCLRTCVPHFLDASAQPDLVPERLAQRSESGEIRNIHVLGIIRENLVIAFQGCGRVRVFVNNEHSLELPETNRLSNTSPFGIDWTKKYRKYLANAHAMRFAEFEIRALPTQVLVIGETATSDQKTIPAQKPILEAVRKASELKLIVDNLNDEPRLKGMGSLVRHWSFPLGQELVESLPQLELKIKEKHLLNSQSRYEPPIDLSFLNMSCMKENQDLRENEQLLQEAGDLSYKIPERDWVAPCQQENRKLSTKRGHVGCCQIIDRITRYMTAEPDDRGVVKVYIDDPDVANASKESISVSFSMKTYTVRIKSSPPLVLGPVECDVIDPERSTWRLSPGKRLTLRVASNPLRQNPWCRSPEPTVIATGPHRGQDRGQWSRGEAASLPLEPRGARGSHRLLLENVSLAEGSGCLPLQSEVKLPAATACMYYQKLNASQKSFLGRASKLQGGDVMTTCPSSPRRSFTRAAYRCQCLERTLQDETFPVKVVAFDFDETLSLRLGAAQIVKTNFQTPWVKGSRIEHLQSMLKALAISKSGKRRALAVLTKNYAGAKAVHNLLHVSGLASCFDAIWALPTGGLYRCKDEWHEMCTPKLSAGAADLLALVAESPHEFFPQLGSDAFEADLVFGNQVLRFCKVARYDGYYRNLGYVKNMGGIGAHCFEDYETLKMFGRLRRLQGLRPESVMLVDDEKENLQSASRFALRYCKVARNCGPLNQLGGIGAHSFEDFELLRRFAEAPWEFQEPHFPQEEADKPPLVELNESVGKEEVWEEMGRVGCFSLQIVDAPWGPDGRA
eukprot:g3100.t2